LHRNPYRSELEIIYEILSVTGNEGRNGLNISGISQKANLNHYAVLDKCQTLIQAGLIKMQRDDRKRSYFLTVEGRKFFEEINRFLNLLSSMNLRF